MFLKKILPIIVILAAAVIFFWRLQNPCTEKVDSTYQGAWQNTFAVKAERKPEFCAFGAAFAGANYIFSARQENSENWREIMTVHLDDPVEISSKSLRIFNENTAYVFMNSKYMVTTDKGITWKTLDVRKDLSLQGFSKAQRISRVNINEEGFGMMTIQAVGDNGRDIELPFLTRDFGQSWENYGK
jgi:hypothetical protein